MSLCVIALLGLAWWGWVPADAADACPSLPANAAWIGVEWTSQPVDDAAVRELAQATSQRRIRYLFPFTTYLKAGGTFNPTYDHAAAFVTAFRRYNPETQLFAWIGIPLANDGLLGIEGTVDLSDPATREQIVVLARLLVEEAGFDGIHLDAETVRSGDRAFLALLDEVKTVIGDRTLSVAGSYWLPRTVNALPILDRFKWDARYYRAVAGRVDQVATMTYDSVMPWAPLYRLWMREQVRAIGRTLAATGAELLIGLSVSREKTLTPRPAAESMQSGLAGLCAAQSRYSSAAFRVDGVAIYAAWEADTADWQRWVGWVGGPTARE